MRNLPPSVPPAWAGTADTSIQMFPEKYEKDWVQIEAWLWAWTPLSEGLGFTHMSICHYLRLAPSDCSLRDACMQLPKPLGVILCFRGTINIKKKKKKRKIRIFFIFWSYIIPVKAGLANRWHWQNALWRQLWEKQSAAPNKSYPFGEPFFFPCTETLIDSFIFRSYFHLSQTLNRKNKKEIMRSFGVKTHFTIKQVD